MTLVMGVNDDAYDPKRHRIVSNASCTTNCVTPLAKVLHDAFAIERGFMTTVHAYTASQPRPRRAAQGSAPGTGGGDQPDPDDDRRDARARNRAAGARGEDRRDRDQGADPGRLDRRSRRRVSRPVERDEVNAAFRTAAEQGPLGGILRYADEPLVSSDIVRSPYSCVFDSQLTMSEGGLVKVFGWYDNEWGYSCRLVDLVERLRTEAER